jgi:hypothetical protein
MLLTQPPPLPGVQVTHGANDGVFAVPGKSVSSVRRSLATVFVPPAPAHRRKLKKGLWGWGY